MSTASHTTAASFVERFAQWRKQRRLERQGRNVASRQMRGGALVARYVLLVVVAIILVGPLVLPLMAAFKAPGESVFGQGATILPQQWSLESFSVLFERTNILGAIRNSAIIAALTVASNVFLSCVGGYMLSRRGWTGRNIMYFVVLSAMIFPFESIMLSLFKMLMLPDPDKQTLMLTLTAIQNSPQGVTYQLVLAGAVVAMVPVVLVFMFSQKFFFRGIEDGGLKF